MIVKNKIKLHNDSVKYMNEVFAMYTEITELSRLIKNPIIHMYHHSDTTDENGRLDGYVDALFFKADIYDTENRLVFKGQRLHDAIRPWKELEIDTIRIFKDLSTMIVFKGSYQINANCAEIDIRKV